MGNVAMGVRYIIYIQWVLDISSSVDIIYKLFALTFNIQDLESRSIFVATVLRKTKYSSEGQVHILLAVYNMLYLSSVQNIWSL